MRAYEQDYAGWAEDTAKAIEEGRWSEIDREALADEVLSLSRSDRWAIVSMLEVLLVHLLKCQHQPGQKHGSWDNTIAVHRLNLARRLDDSPSLRARSAELIADAYKTARLESATQTRLKVSTFPETCEWSVEEVLGH